MVKPPKATPNSDLDGVHQDERSNVEIAGGLGQSAEELERARKKSKGRPGVEEDAGEERD